MRWHRPFHTNPAIDSSAPDPSVIRADDGILPVCNGKHTQIHRYSTLARILHIGTSSGTAFTDETRPDGFRRRHLSMDINKMTTRITPNPYGEVYGMQVSEWLTAGSRRVLSWTKEYHPEQRAIGIWQQHRPFYMKTRAGSIFSGPRLRGIFGAELTATASA